MKRIVFILLAIINSSVLFSQYNWVQIGQSLLGDNANDQAGRSVSINSKGDIVAMGIYNSDGASGTQSGVVKVFNDINGSWSQIGNPISGEVSGDWSGWSVCLDSTGNTLAIGAIRNDGGGNSSGHVRVYVNVNNNWLQIGQDIDGDSAGDNSGYSVNLSADGLTLAIGSIGNEFIGAEAGQVRVFELINNVWTPVGQDLYGETWYANFGTSVKLSNDGSILAIGAAGQQAGKGYVYVYENINNVWTQIGQSIIGEANDDLFGHDLSLSDNGKIIAIGARQNDGNGNNAGQVRIFEYNGTNWIQLGQTLNGTSSGDKFGISVSLNSLGNLVAVGATNNGENGVDAGQVKIYEYINTNWTLASQNINGADSIDHCGSSVSMNSNGNRVAIGSQYNSDNGLFSGNVRVFETSFLNIKNNSLNEFIIYPNPSTGLIYIKQEQNIERTVAITDIAGKIIITNTISNYNTNIDLSDLKSGVYFIKISSKNTILKTIKLIVE